ncbi:MexH family multidrug efflux RND transporter periplasmic adaptor subunit [Marivirga lumbricoides]|uniref:MexH family multidrug efflux RND transporter periplasmic adaptor subunit n=1 Tax=Marivirga lumbricoides TaxID=1046115 RepID=A0ABQ1LQV3_9BACT|nr:MexH family multidrug efflux RND transporter periplasmic adaptor subunit [Marivirga lumbricoides]
MSKTVQRVITLIAILIVLGLIIYPKLPIANEEGTASASKNTPAPGAGATTIDAEIVQFKSFDNNIVLTGSLLANESVNLSSEISGKVNRIYFDEGQYVKKGQLLVTTNVADLQANLQRLQYSVQLNEQTENRQKQLLEKGAISKEEYDIAFTNYKTAQSEIESLKAQIDKSKIVAPFSGYIGLRYISEGSYISPSTQIASLYSIDPIKVEFSVPSRYSTLIKQGNEIGFTTEASSEERKATVYAIEPQIDPVTRTLKVRAQSNNDDGALIPGQFIRIQLTLDSNSKTILVPTTAIMPESDGHLVYVINDGEALAKRVELGVRTADQVEVLSGLSRGDTIAIAGVPQLKDRAPVEIKRLEGGKK